MVRRASGPAVGAAGMRAAAACAALLACPRAAAAQDPCEGALTSLCGAQAKVSVDACKACIVDNIDALATKNCNASQEVAFCDVAPAPAPATPPPVPVPPPPRPPPGPVTPAQFAAALKTQVGGSLAQQSSYWGPHSAISFAYHSGDDTVVAAAGLREDGGVAATTADFHSFGSTVKTYTGVAVLRLVEQGKLSIDEPVAPYADPLLGGESLTSLFGPDAARVTIGQLLNMHSGLADYDADDCTQYQLAHPTEDLSPLTLLRFAAGKPWVCAPGACGAYSSTNYVVLGLLLARVANASSWDQYDQREVLRAAAGGDAGAALNATEFAVHGSYAQHGSAAHPMTHGYTATGVDVYNVSAVDGWTAGNLIATTADVARFMYRLFGSPRALLGSETLYAMTRFEALTPVGVPPFSAKYGQAAMLIDDGTVPYNQSFNCGRFYGHGGSAPGFYSFSGYNDKYDFGLSIATNMETATFQQNIQQIFQAVYAVVMDLVVQRYGHR